MTTPTPALLGSTLDALREHSPLVQCLTNIVAASWSANVLLAAGAAPAMVDNPREAAQFAAIAQGVLINIGTPYAETKAGMAEAVRAAHEHGTPWVLDAVAAGGLGDRTAHARAMLASRPAIVRGNASEIQGLAGGEGGRGVDGVHDAADVLDSARRMAGEHGCVVAVSGPVDHIVDAERTVRIHNGHPLMTRVTGVGCSLGALMAGFAAVTDDALVAAAAATALMTVAGDAAAETAAGPGSFAVALLDQLELLGADDVAARVRLS